MDTSRIDLNDIHVHWTSDIPVANIRQNLEQSLPPGVWLPLDQVIAHFNAAREQLMKLVGQSISGTPLVLINRENLTEICLAEIPAPQQRLDFPSEIIASSDESQTSRNNSCVPTNSESSQAIATAINTCEALLKQNDQGEPISAEQFLQTMTNSLDPALTGNALEMADGGQTVHGQLSSFSPQKHKPFPRSLESSEEFHFRFSDFGEVGSGVVLADFKRLHQAGKTEETNVGHLLRNRKRLPIALSGSTDSFLFRLGATAGIDLDAIATITLSTRDQSIEKLTLKKLLDPKTVVSQLRDIVSKYQFPIDHI